MGVQQVTSIMTFADRLGTLKVRWGVGRMRYTVEPGLYAVGSPTAESPVLVSANFKLSFDHVRVNLAGRDAWILVLDTKGINVWCAAGKGTFGTDEIVARAEEVGLRRVVNHRKLIVPQLGAPGVSAHQVKERSGFRVLYGPVRAGDIPAYLDANMRATPEMRRVRFPLRYRLALVPLELVALTRPALIVSLVFLLLAGLDRTGFSLENLTFFGSRSVLLFLSAYIAGTTITPLLLPWIPGRAFSTKGALAGLALLFVLALCPWLGAALFQNHAATAGWFLLFPSVSAFLAMNFTGASTYTSLSGVQREIRVALPLEITAMILGILLWIAGRFF